MKMTKGNPPANESRGMQSDLGASPDNNPTKSKSCDLGFSSKNMPKKSGSSRHQVAAKQSGK